MKYILLIAVSLIFSLDSFAQKKATNNQQKKVIYTYKKYEKLDFDDLVIEGDTGSYSELSITPMKDMGVRNKLPYRRNFNEQVKKGVMRVR